MTLDPFFQQMLQTPPPFDITKMPMSDARAAASQMFQAMGAKDIPIGKTEMRAAPGPGGDIALRVYTPVAAAPVLPAIVFFHGGGFVIGDLDTYDGVCRALCNESGARVISVDYRLAPEHPFPAAVDDSFAALKWIEANASTLCIDPNAIAVAGDSAGANLAAVMTMLAKKGGPKIAFQLLIYPTLDMKHETESMRLYGEGYFLDRAAMTWFGRAYVPKGSDLNDFRLAPLAATDFSGLPPAYIVTAGYDPLRDEGAMYARKLKDAGVAATLVDYPSMIHGFIAMSGLVPVAGEALAAAAHATKAALAKA